MKSKSKKLLPKSENRVLSPIFIADVKSILSAARKKAYTAISTAMVEAYWQIGKRIVVEEQQGKKRAEYGEHILLNLSRELASEFGKGFSYANLRNFRQFYLHIQIQDNLLRTA